MTDDDRLMVRIQEGDSTAFDELVGVYQDRLLSFFHRNTHDAQRSEDLTQETLLRVYNQAWDYLPLGRFRSWMFRIGRNLLIDDVRRRSHDALVHAIKGSSEDDVGVLARVAAEIIPPEERANYRELAGMVDTLLDDLPEEQRLTFTLHHFAGLSLSEVGDVMETSTSTSKSRLRLAREKLREQLREKGVIDPNAPVA